MMSERKLDGTVDESLADQGIHKSEQSVCKHVNDSVSSPSTLLALQL